MEKNKLGDRKRERVGERTEYMIGCIEWGRKRGGI